MIRRYSFSLIELLIVVGILGALSALILPMFNDTQKEAKHTIARTKMRDVQRAFARFHADLLPALRKTTEGSSETTNPYLEDISLYGLWPLFTGKHPVLNSGTASSYPVFDPETQFGWHGPYLEYDSTAQIAAPVAGGAQAAGTDCRIPVLRDPYGGYFRILCPEQRSETDGGNALPLFERLKRMVIVCTGPDRILDTTAKSFIPKTDESYIQHINGDDISAQNDDIILRLTPTFY